LERHLESGFGRFDDKHAMKIHVSLTALRQTGWTELVLRFLLGGGITASAGFIAMKFCPVIGGLLLAFPAILPAGLTLVEKHEDQKMAEKGMRRGRRGRQAAAATAAGAILGSCGMIMFGFIVWQLAPYYQPWIVLGSATLVWSAVALCLWALRRHVHAFIQRCFH
jgi:hypothetical protein